MTFVFVVVLVQEIMYASITLPLMRFKQNEREQSIEFELAGIQVEWRSIFFR